MAKPRLLGEGELFLLLALLCLILVPGLRTGRLADRGLSSSDEKEVRCSLRDLLPASAGMAEPCPLDAGELFLLLLLLCLVLFPGLRMGRLAASGLSSSDEKEVAGSL